MSLDVDEVNAVRGEISKTKAVMKAALSGVAATREWSWKWSCRIFEPRDWDRPLQVGRWQLGDNCIVGQSWRRKPESQVLPAQ